MLTIFTTCTKGGEKLTVIWIGLCSSKIRITNFQGGGTIWREETLWIEHGIEGWLGVAFIQSNTESVREQPDLLAACEACQVRVIQADDVHLQ